MGQALINQTRQIRLANHTESAKTPYTRLKGLLGRDQLAAGHALWIEPCNSIHTCFMRFAIDAVFVDRELRVKKVVRNLRPWKMVWPVVGARSVFEFTAGSLTQDLVAEGDQLHVGD